MDIQSNNPALENHRLCKKRQKVREYLRDHGVLPSYGEPLTEDQQKIINQIENNDFSYKENLIYQSQLMRKEQMKMGSYQNKPAIIKQPSLSLEERQLSKKRKKVREYLRNYGVLPPYGDPLTEEQEEILLQIENNDFSYQQKLARNNQISATKTPGINPLKDSDNAPKHVYFRLRMVQILPPLGEPLSEIHQQIIDDVRDNWQDKTKNYFITKYLSYSTPEGRLLYRAYKKHKDEGFIFNLKAEDIIIPKYCPLLETDLSTDPKDSKEPNYATIDRIDSSKGYVKGNIRIISQKANKMKTSATQEQLLQFATNGIKLIENLK